MTLPSPSARLQLIRPPLSETIGQLTRKRRKEAPEGWRRLAIPFSMSARPLLFFVLGGPGAGKTLQSRLARDALHAVHHRSAGELLRAFVAGRGDNDGGVHVDAAGPRDWSAAEEGHWKERCKKLLAEGTVVPSDVTVRLLARAMARAESDAARGIIIDGFPRNESNRKAFVEHVRVHAHAHARTSSRRDGYTIRERHEPCRPAHAAVGGRWLRTT